MKTLSRLILGAIALLTLPIATTNAQQAGALAIEEVVVTARKRAESLQEVPIAITVFTEQTIARAGIERPADYISLMPNVTIVDTANVGDTQVSIRGIISTRDAESTFAYVVDGILSTNPNSFNEELVDVQQIEVVKGPQGALYGRNAVAGAVLVTTKEPGDEFEGMIRAGAGEFGHQKLSARLSGPLGDNFRASLSASYRNEDGQYTNALTGADDVVDYLEDTAIRARAIWDVNDDLSIDLRAGTSAVEGGAINFNAAFAVPLFAAAFESETFNANVNDVPFIYAFNVPGENEQDTSDFSIKADWSWGDIDVTGLLSFNTLDEYLLSDGTSATFFGYTLTPACSSSRTQFNNAPPDLGGANRTDLFGPFFQPFGVFPDLPGLEFEGVYGPYTATTCDGYQYQERNQEDVGFELRFTSPQDEAFRWIAGIYAAEIDREVVVAYGVDSGQGFLRQPYIPGDATANPLGPPANAPNPTDLLFWDDFETSVIAVFGEASWDVGEAMEVALALRWDQEDRKVKNKVPAVLTSGYNFNASGVPINPAFNSDLDPIPDRSRKFDQLQPKLTWRWSANDRVNVFASYGIGFRSGGFNSIGSAALLDLWFNTSEAGNTPGDFVDARLVVNDEYDKEVSQALELGFKSQFMDDRVRLNASVFRTDVEDNQFFEFFAGPFGILRVVTTIDELYIQGFEADLAWQATNNFAFYAGLGLLDSEIEANVNRPLSVGNDVPQAPSETYNLGGEFDFPIGNNMNLFARLDWQHVGETWFHTLQTEDTPNVWNIFPNFQGLNVTSNFSRAKRDAYDTLNLRVGLEGEQWSVVAWGRNITDERYLEEVIPAPEFGGSFIHQSRGAAFGAELTWRF